MSEVPLSELARRLAISASHGVDPEGMILGALADGLITSGDARALRRAVKGVVVVDPDLPRS